uniref:Uncharacterized protein n=1 Tax=Glossina austeni TaxID=7395 RepID=A0A1A9VW09_GLOAU
MNINSDNKTSIATMLRRNRQIYAVFASTDMLSCVSAKICVNFSKTSGFQFLTITSIRYSDSYGSVLTAVKALNLGITKGHLTLARSNLKSTENTNNEQRNRLLQISYFNDEQYG